MRISVLDAFKECWNQMVDCLSQTRARSSLDAEFFESIRCIEIEEFVTVEGRYETESEIVNSVNTDTVDVQMHEGFLDTIVNYTRRKYMSKKDENVIREKDLHLEVEKDVNLMPRVERYEGDEVADVELVTSKKKRKESVYNFHKVVATRSDVSSKELASARKEAFTKTCTASAVLKMPSDGHCLFWSLGYFFRLTALNVRRKLWDSCTEEEKSEMLYINVFDGSDSGLGKTNCLRVYSRVFKCNVCVHGVIDGKAFVTEAYSDGCRYDKTVHLLWTVLGENGHVDVICESETDGDTRLSKFLLDNDFHVSASKLDNN